MSFEIRKLTPFPIEKLYYLLKLEVLEQMERNEAIELAKVNVGFRSILLRKPWIVFGRHVLRISSFERWMTIEKFPGPLFNWLLAEHLPLVKQIRSCDTLWLELPDEQLSDEYVKILSLLNSVKHLHLEVYRDDSFNLLKFLENFRAMIGKSASIRVDLRLLRENEVLSELFKNFIASQLNDCEEISFGYVSAADFHFYNDLFARTSIKFLKMTLMFNVRDLMNWNAHDFEEIVQSIVKRQIPSKDLRAVFYMYSDGSQDIYVRTVDFLSRYPAMKQLDGENQQEVSKMTMELLKKLNYIDYGFNLKDCLFFRRNIDASRDCVYLPLHCTLTRAPKLHFFAFYVRAQLEIMEF